MFGAMGEPVHATVLVWIVMPETDFMVDMDGCSSSWMQIPINIF